MQIFGFIYALLRAFPIAERAVRDFIAFYIVKEREWYEKAVDAGVIKAIESKDQRDLEKSIGSDKAGKPSEQDGTEWRD